MRNIPMSSVIVLKSLKRCESENIGVLAGLTPIPTYSLSQSVHALLIISRWPTEGGSKDPA